MHEVIPLTISWKKLIPCLLLPLLAGGLSSLLSGDIQAVFDALQKPPLTPPGWVFPVVWTVLYLMMGLASYLVLASSAGEEKIRGALTVYGLQLFANFFWPILFFRLEAFLPAFLLLLLLFALILLTIGRFRALSRAAGLLLLPYAVWVAFAGYLNFSICLLNR